jgi:hypothetical protein
LSGIDAEDAVVRKVFVIISLIKLLYDYLIGSLICVDGDTAFYFNNGFTPFFL